MSFRWAICLSLFALAAAGSSESASSQLRGSAAAGASIEDQPDLQCSCNQAGECSCDDTLNASSVQDEGDLELKQELLNQTQELHAWWLAQGNHAGQVACSCTVGNETCECADDSTLVEAPLLNATEQPLSLWWVAGGGARWRGRRWGRRWGGGCRHVRAGGCRCRFRGCGCGVVRGGGCGWR